MPAKPHFGDLPFLLARASHGFRALTDRTLKETGLDTHMRPTMGSILFALFHRDGRQIKELVETLRIPNGTLTGILNQMEKGGLIERRSSPTDGRAFTIHLTERGASLKPLLEQRHVHVLATLQQNLSASDLATLKRLLGVVIENMWSDAAAES